MFLPFGPVHSITMPMADVKGKEKSEEGEAEEKNPVDAKPRNKGFAFVWMVSKKDAENAMEGCNGKPIRAGLAEELVSGKQKKKKQLRLEKKAKAAQGTVKTDEGAEGGDDKMDVDEEAESKKVVERVIAVDWALSKEKWKEELAKMEEGSDKDSEDGSYSESESEESDDEGLGVHDGDSDDETTSSRDGLSDDERDSDDEEPTKPSLPEPEAGTTLFVRNLPYIATEEELRLLCVSGLSLCLSLPYSSFQVPSIWTPSLRSHHHGPGYRSLKRNWLRLLLEQGRRRQGHRAK